MEHDTLLDPLRALCAAMPPVAAMQVRVERFDGARLWLAAPLAANVNDKGSAFGGSLVSLMTLAGWGLTTLELRRAGLAAEVYVADSSVRYHAPLEEDLRAEAWLDPDAGWEAFTETFQRRGKARATLHARVCRADGTLATTLSGRYVALGRR